jgi:hypothetical protein
MRIILLITAIVATGLSDAADIGWVGDVNGDFQNGANWESDPVMPNPATDIHRFKNSSGPTTITNVSVALSGTGTSPGTNQGQILFESTAPAYVLQGGTISLPAGTFNNAIVLSSGSTVTQTIGSNLVIGNGATASASIVNHSTSGGLLKVTGNISGGTGAGTLGAISFNFGNASTQNGNYQVTGNITKGGASSIFLIKNGSGTLTLGGTNDLTSLGQNQAGSTIVINGGKTSILNSVQSNWGGGQVSSLIKITGGELYANEAFGLRSKLEIDGGTLTIGSAATESGLIFGSHASMTGEVLTLKSGTLDFASSKNGGYTRGVQLFTTQNNSSISGAQTGGDFLVNGRSAAGQVFTLGSSTTTGTSTSYSLSGGLLDIKGLSGTTGFLQINADAAGTSTTTFTLSGTGKLISRFNPSSAGGIAGGVAGGRQILDLQGGTLVAGRIDAANLRGLAPGANAGTIVNNGTKLSPGDDGSTGKTTLSGNLVITSGSLAIDIGGTSVSSAWQDASGSGKFDQLAVTGNVALGGELSVRLAGGFIPERDHSFAVVTGASVTGGFSNVQWGTRMLTADGLASFIPSLENNSVILRYFDWQGAAPHITRHPVSLVALTGKSATFNIELLGRPPFSYQWYKNGTAIAGATLPWFTIGSVSSADAGSYHVLVSNSSGSATSSAATLTVNASTTALDRILYAMNQTPVTGNGAILDASGLTSGTMLNSPLPKRITGAISSTSYAWDFAKSASYLQVPANSFLNKLGDIRQATGITVSGWINLDYQADGSTPDSNACHMGNVLKVHNTAAKLNFTFGSAPVLSTSNTQLDGNWHHYAAAFDFQKQTNNLVLYVDGVAVSTRTFPVTASFCLPGTNLGIGASNTGSHSWPGQIDEFSIHSRALVASEVVSLYNSNTITATAPHIVVSADSNTIQWPAQNSTTLRAVVTPTVSGTWSKTSGPTATIANTGSASTNVTFSGPGTYVFRYTATSGGVSNFGEMVIRVLENQAPVITQSLVTPDQLGLLNPDRRVNLKARATDDALPNPPGLLTSIWTQLSGPATVTVTYPELWETPATIPAVAGTYVMRFSVTDSSATTHSDVSIVVLDSLPPVVTAGSDAHTISWNGAIATTTLRGIITDDGRPLSPGALTGTWTQVSGPAAGFAAPVATAANTGSLTADTQVTLPAIGQYVFRFTGSDGGASAETTTWINVWAPGAIKVSAGASRMAWLPNATLTLEGSHSANSAATVEWSSVHGPAPVTFSSPAALATQATFSAAGKYRIQLNVTEGSYTGQDTLVVEIYEASKNFGYSADELQSFTEDPKLNYIHDHAQWSRVAPPPPPYVHPRILFNPDDLPDLRQRLSATTTSGQLAMANIRTSAAKVTVPTATWRPAYDALAAGDATVFNALSSTDRSGMATSLKNECFRALIDDDAAGAAKAGAVLAGLADSIYQTLPSILTSPSTNWRAFLQGPCYGDTLGWGYDFVYNHMTDAQRTSVRRTLALMTNEIWNVGLDGLPGFNSNVSNWIPLTGQTLLFNTLAIEGEEGSDPDLALRYMALYDRMCDSMAFPDGATFEGMGKGWIGLETYFALAKRGHKGIFSEMARNHLRKFYIHCMEPYGYGFNWDEVNGGSNTPSNGALGFRDVQVAKFLFPADPLVDFVYRNACGTNYNAKFTGGGLLEAICAENIANPSQTWAQALAAQVAPSTPLSQFFNKRGLFTTRSEWSANALKLQFQPRSVPGGHSHPDRNSFALSGLGRTWVRWYTYASGSGYVPGDPTMATSVVRVDNKGSSTLPASVVDFHDSAEFSYTASDARDPYGKTFGGNFEPTGFSFNDKLLIKSPLSWADRRWADLPDWYNSQKTTAHHTRFIRDTRAVKRAFRTASLVRGGSGLPYSVIVDDIQMDQAVHNYKWRIMLDSDLTQVTVNGNDAIVTAPGSSSSMLVRLLSSSAPATFRTGETDEWIRWPWLDIEVNAVAPDFKVLLLPFQNGTPLPTTTWRGQVLDVSWAGGQTDHLLFAADADGRTRLNFSRGAADTVAPVLTLPSDITTTATGADGAVVTFTATATDDVDGPLPVTCSPPSGSTFPIGTTTVQCSAHDSSLNGAGGTFNVTVLPGGFSLTAPVVTAQGGNSSASLMWDVIAPAASYTVKRSTTSGSGFVTVASGITGTRFDDSGISNGTTYYYTVTAVNGAGQGPASAQVSVTPTSLPHGWSAGDIGSFGVAGTSVLGADGSAILTSSGSGFGSTSDSFHFASREWNGDGSIVVRMLGFQNATNFARGGIMFRQSTAANAAFGFVGSIYYASNYSFTSRASAGAGLVNSTGTHSAMPQWFKLTRSGSTITAFQSQNSSPGVQNWKLVGTAQVPLNSPLLAGLAHFSTNTTNTTTTSFDHFGIYTPPTINPQADITRAATRPDGAHVDFTVTGNSNVDGRLLANCTPDSGSLFPVGTTTVTATVKDTAGQSTTTSFTVTVTGNDATPPQITIPTDITTHATTATGAIVHFTASASDLVSGPLPVTCVPASGSLFPIGTTLVQASATDAAGNTAHASFLVTVTVPQVAEEETRAPVLSLGENAASLRISDSVPGRTYQLQQSPDLQPHTWSNVGPVIHGDGGDVNLTAPVEATTLRRFYRVLLGP